MTCRACGHHTTKVMDFGSVALAGAFLKPEEFEAEKRYPLTLQFCEKCLLVQTGEAIPAATLFERYFYHSSATETMKRHFAAYARELVSRFQPKRVLEIGCNDGVLLRPLQALGIDAMGIDPSDTAPDDLPIIKGYWPIPIREPEFDLILANNVFAHIEDINGACAAVARAMTEDGSFVFEVNRLDSLIADLQYDWIYHEHLFYFSLLALDNLLARHGIEIYDMQRLGTHAGSARYYACKKGQKSVTRMVENQREREKWQGLNELQTFRDFAKRAEAHRDKLRKLVGQYGKVAGYGACGRTNTLLQWSGLDSRHIAYIIDDAPAKHGFYTPGTHIPIVGPVTQHPEIPPDCMIIFAWSFLQEIQPKLRHFHGDVVIPLPHVYTQRERRAA